MEDRIIQLTSELVAIPTHETEAAAQDLPRRVARRRAGSTATLHEVAPDRPNLVARRDGTGGVFLCSHVDVASAARPPRPVHRAGATASQLIGRGVLDAKGQIAAAVAAVEAEPRHARVRRHHACDEEFGGLGSEHVSFPDGPWSHDGGIVLEPTDFAICTAQAGNIDLRVEVSADRDARLRARGPSGRRSMSCSRVIEAIWTRARSSKQEHPLSAARA